MTSKRKYRLVLATIVFIVILMWFAPFGSFNPMSAGFWGCVIGGAVWATIVYFLFKKYASESQQ